MRQCEYMAESVLRNKETHYHAAVTPSKLEQLSNYKGKEGFFIKKFLINDKFNVNKWKVTWEAILLDAKGFIGQPIVMTPSWDHPPSRIQEDYRIGEIIDIGLDEINHTVWQVSHITDENAIAMIREGKAKYGSATVLVKSMATTEIKYRGTPMEETILHRFTAAHDCMVQEPAYGKEVDKITAVCDGSGEGCGLKLLEVSAVVNGDNTDQITIVGFLKDSLKKNFKASTLNSIVKSAMSGASDSCVSKKIKIIMDEDSTMSNDQAIAIAYSYCEKSSMEESMTKSILSMKEEIQMHTKLTHEIENTQQKIEILHS